ncbi:hypothetical protein BOX15_Mlig033868g1, partial [Macrostomum lignano]
SAAIACDDCTSCTREWSLHYGPIAQISVEGDGAVDVKEQWNQVLATQLLPDCYGSLLEAAKAVYPNVQSVHHFYSLLPEYHASNQTLWGQLAKLVFQNAFRFRWAIFPVHSVLEKQQKWLPLAQSSGDVSGSAAFLTPNNLTEYLQNVLSKLRFPIMVPDYIGLRQSLESSQLEFTPLADAVSICAFLRGPACKRLRDSLPSDVSATSFQTPEAVEACSHICLMNYKTRCSISSECLEFRSR